MTTMAEKWFPLARQRGESTSPGRSELSGANRSSARFLFGGLHCLWPTSYSPLTESSSAGCQALPTVTFPMQSGGRRMRERSHKSGEQF